MECEQQLRPSTVQFTAQTATDQWIFVYQNQNGRPRRREQNRIYLYAARKSEAEVTRQERNIHSTYCTIEANYWQSDTKHRAVSLRQQGYLLLCDFTLSLFSIFITWLKFPIRRFKKLQGLNAYAVGHSTHNTWWDIHNVAVPRQGFTQPLHSNFKTLCTSATTIDDTHVTQYSVYVHRDVSTNFSCPN